MLVCKHGCSVRSWHAWRAHLNYCMNKGTQQPNATILGPVSPGEEGPEHGISCTEANYCIY